MVWEVEQQSFQGQRFSAMLIALLLVATATGNFLLNAKSRAGRAGRHLTGRRGKWNVRESGLTL